jgi:hypothetical protein
VGWPNRGGLRITYKWDHRNPTGPNLSKVEQYLLVQKSSLIFSLLIINVFIII